MFMFFELFNTYNSLYKSGLYVEISLITLKVNYLKSNCYSYLKKFNFYLYKSRVLMPSFSNQNLKKFYFR
jgi:hypothetical protein